MSSIEVHRPHDLDQTHAREVAEELARDLSRKFDVNYEWDGEVMRFQRSGIKGRLDITPEDFRVQLEVGLMLSPFRGRIEEEIHKQLDKIINRS